MISEHKFEQLEAIFLNNKLSTEELENQINNGNFSIDEIEEVYNILLNRFDEEEKKLYDHIDNLSAELVLLENESLNLKEKNKK